MFFNIVIEISAPSRNLENIQAKQIVSSFSKKKSEHTAAVLRCANKMSQHSMLQWHGFQQATFWAKRKGKCWFWKQKCAHFKDQSKDHMKRPFVRIS